jgi:predicted double-glycine peptidase
MMGRSSLKVVDNSVSNERLSGLACVAGYEPWVMRSIASAKQVLADGYPLLARVHSAADYPLETEEDSQRLDMESHAILFTGYDENRGVFYISDPWNPDTGGKQGGQREITFEEYAIVMVNATRSKFAVMAAPVIEPIIYKGDNFRCIQLKVGFYTPRGYILDQHCTAITGLDISIDFGTITSSRKIYGRWEIGDYATLSYPIPTDIEGNVQIKIISHITLEGARPYRYQDVIEYSFDKEVEVGCLVSTDISTNSSIDSAIGFSYV